MLLKKNLRHIIAWSVCLVLLLISLGFSGWIDGLIVKWLSNEKHIVAKDKLIIHFIDVGQADAVAINFPNGEIALIDCGSQYSANSYIEYLKSKVFKDGSEVVDYLFYSHSDIDHTGGMKSVLYNFEVKNVIRPREYASFESLTSNKDSYIKSESYDETMKAVYEEKANIIKAETGLKFEIGEAIVEVYYPDLEEYVDNNFSYLIRLEYKSKVALFTGDMDNEAEENLVKNYFNKLNCDILKVAHHGSDSSSSESFLNCCKADYAVISVGKNNWGHPTNDVITRLKDSGIKDISRTDLSGNIIFSLDEKIDKHLGEVLISYIQFSYKQLAWCIVFVIVCNQVYWYVNLAKAEDERQKGKAQKTNIKR